MKKKKKKKKIQRHSTADEDVLDQKIVAETTANFLPNACDQKVSAGNNQRKEKREERREK